jgi:putative membrane protein
MENNPKSAPEPSSGEISTLLSRQRTTLAFQRTRLAADRTLMSVIRTALSLISFGFTIFHFFRSIKDLVKQDLKTDTGEAAGKFGLALVALGIAMLFLGIIYHANLMLQVRKERERMNQEHNIMQGDTFPVSLTLIIAVLLFLLGLYIIFKMIVDFH